MSQTLFALVAIQISYDPSTWCTSVILRREQGTELFEYVCQQSNYAPNLMVGDYREVDRRSVIVP